MSKYSKKVERQIKQARKIAENNNKRTKEKEETRQLKAEKKRVRKEIRRIEEFQAQEKEKEKTVLEKRRQLRKKYLESLQVGDIRVIELASQNILNYEVGLKLQKQNLHQHAMKSYSEGELTQ